MCGNPSQTKIITLLALGQFASCTKSTSTNIDFTLTNSKGVKINARLPVRPNLQNVGLLPKMSSHMFGNRNGQKSCFQKDSPHIMFGSFPSDKLELTYFVLYDRLII